MNEKTKNILKVAGIWYGITFVLSLVLGYFLYSWSEEIYTLKTNLEIWAYATLAPILIPIITCIIFSPAIILLFFLFKKIKNIDCRILLIAFFIPFTNLIYFIIENLNNNTPFLSLIIGGNTLFTLLPLIFIVTFCTPQKLLPIKWEIIKTSCFTGLLGWFFIILLFITIESTRNITNANKLKKYEPLIQSIEELKIQNGTYPYDISRTSKIKNNTSTYPHYEYINRENNYILTVHTSKFVQFNYCSDNSMEECQSGWHKYRLQDKFGIWTRSVEDD